MKCSGCGKEIPAKDQKHTEVAGEKIPRPCDVCFKRLKKASDEYPEPGQKKKV